MIDQDDLAQLESTLLPALERHHLRLLAHGLRTLQAIAPRSSGALPPPGEIVAWAGQQPSLAADPHFSAAFLTQLEGLGSQLEAIAATNGCLPLELDIPQLVSWAQRSADGRLKGPAAPTTPPAV